MFKLIKNVDLYAPEHLGKRDILICGEKVVRIEENITAPFEDTVIIDGEGKVCIPGMIDQHVHVTGGGGESSFKSRVTEILMTDIVKNGVTTVVGLLGTDSTTRSVHNLLAKTKALNAEGITAFCLTGAYELPSPTITGSVKNDITYIEEIIGCKLAIADHRSSYVTKQELLRLATQVRHGSLIGGKPGVLHMHTGKDKLGLKDVIAIVEETDIPIKHFRPTHCGNLLEDAIKFAKMGGNIDFTTGPNEGERAKMLVDVMNQVNPELVTISSDSNGSMPIWGSNNELIGMGTGKIETLYATVKALVLECGMPLEKAITLVTSNVAKGIDQYPRKGAIQVGSDADIVFLGENMAIDTVIARGQVMVEKGENIVMGYYGK